MGPRTVAVKSLWVNFLEPLEKVKNVQMHALNALFPAAETKHPKHSNEKLPFSINIL